MKTSIALGFFDGVHLAHQKIISSAVSFAADNGLAAAALTFDRAPAEVLFGTPRSFLTDNCEKRRLIEGLGAEFIKLPTEPELLSMKGEAFVELLADKFSAAALFCGYNYTFGSDRLGAADLERLGGERGLCVNVLPEERLLGGAVSSSRIKELLAHGNMEAVKELLGRPYSVTGTVEHGKRLGRTMGFPTLNIYPKPGRAAMPLGVYAAWAGFDGESRAAVANIGINPTVGDKNMRIEAHLPNFEGDLYGKSVTISFVRFMRPEKKFASVRELFDQIASDAREAEEILN